MPSLRIYNHGASGGTPGMNAKPSKRGTVSGWTAQSSRRNMQFLWSVRTDDLTGKGWSFTLTIRDCPDTPKDWAEWCRVYWKRLFDHGAIRLHWVIEWQRRGCPHLHGSIYFPESMTEAEVENLLLDGWCYRNPYGPGRQQQRCLPIYDAVGWAQYVAKHAARGVQHYQRSSENIPEHWKGQTGRIWGKRGEWPVSAPLKLELEDWRGDGGWYVFRRLVRSYAVSQARLKGDRAAQLYARTMLRAKSRDLAEVRGISSWVPISAMERLIENVDARGYAVRSAQTDAGV